MYDRPETADAHDALWQAVRRHHDEPLPERLSRGVDPQATWARGDLVLGQICGFPFRRIFRDSLVYLGTGVYDIEARPGYYRSVWVARADDARQTLAEFAGATLAYNERGSFSGFVAPCRAATGAAITFDAMVETGSHVGSASAVAACRADLAAIDAVSWRAITRHDACAAQLRVFGMTAEAPGLAFVAAPGFDAGAMHAALAAAIGVLESKHRDALGLHGLVRIPLLAYDTAHAAPET
jgi:ABC-type phosphate/phosphonate transport system substrate-binding protein